MSVYYAGYEVKKWTRDSLTAFMLVYPLLLAAIGRFLVPLISDQLGFSLSPWYHAILSALALITAKISGAIVGFSILDDRDDNILLAVKVAPMTLEAFIGLKLLLVYLFSFIGCAFVIWFSNLTPLTSGVILGISALSAFEGPLVALLINCFASNKIEGFAAIKSLNALVVFPIVALFMKGAKEFIFAFEPGFWPAKALSLAVLNQEAFQLTYQGYFWIGLAYVLVANVAAYLWFKRRV